MKKAIDTYKEAIDKQLSIISYTIDMIDTFGGVPSGEDGVSAESLNDLFSSFKKAGKTEYSEFIYNGVIVSLYGAFERLVENIVESYLKSVSKSSKCFNDLPNTIQKKHTELSLFLAQKVGKDRNISSEEKSKLQTIIVNNLSDCMENSSEFNLNVRAFSTHTANFRLDIVRESFSNIGLTTFVDDLQSNLVLVDYIKNDKGYPGSDEINKSIIFNEIKFNLDDLANRRNEIAHGSKPQDYLNYTLLLSLSEFMKVLGCAIYDVCLASDTDIKLNNINLDDPSYSLIHSAVVFMEHNAVGFKVDDCEGLNGFELKLGTKILIADNSKKILYESTITSLIVNKVSVNDFKISEPFEFAIQLDIPLENSFSKRNFYFYNK